MSQICNPINSIMLIYTQKCNIECNHCLYNCSPDKKEKLMLQSVLSLIDCFPKFGVKQLEIAGGEPSLYLEEILKIISKAKKQGVQSTLLTNGFWASSKEKAEEIVFELKNAGLTRLGISADEFHQKFIPKQNIFNIVDSAGKQKLGVYLNFCFLNGFSPFDSVCKKKDFFGKTDLRKLDFDFYFQPVLPFGRALEKIPEEKYVFKKKVFKEKCPLKQMAINYDGNGFVCCAALAGRSPVFMLNDSKIDFPEKLIESYQKSLFVFYLRQKGPYFILQLAKKQELRKAGKTKKLLKKYACICDYCEFNLSQYSREDLEKLLSGEFEKGNY